jgi:hypothetical protein
MPAAHPALLWFVGVVEGRYPGMVQGMGMAMPGMMPMAMGMNPDGGPHHAVPPYALVPGMVPGHPGMMSGHLAETMPGMPLMPGGGSVLGQPPVSFVAPGMNVPIMGNQMAPSMMPGLSHPAGMPSGVYPGVTVDPATGLPQWVVPPGMSLVPTADAMDAYNQGAYSPERGSGQLAGARQRGGRGRNAKMREMVEHSKTNVYISGLKPSTTDDDLRELCHEYGVIVSAKAIIDREQNICKGYGFVMYESEIQARQAVDSLVRKGVQAAFAKISKPNDTQVLQNVDPTNLYLTNLPTDHDEDALHAMLSGCQAGEVVSCRVLRDENGESRRVGLARMDSHDACEAIVKRLNGCILTGSVEALRVK